MWNTSPREPTFLPCRLIYVLYFSLPFPTLSLPKDFDLFFNIFKSNSTMQKRTVTSMVYLALQLLRTLTVPLRAKLKLDHIWRVKLELDWRRAELGLDQRSLLFFMSCKKLKQKFKKSKIIFVGFYVINKI
jgi:hypothetical protein